MAQLLRVFISSPGDVRDGREIVAQCIERVAEDYQRHFRIEPYLWENEPLVASRHFQDTIEAPSQFDIVVLLLWSRLGTLLPIETSVRRYVGLDGRAARLTGTRMGVRKTRSNRRAREDFPTYSVYRCLNRRACRHLGPPRKRGEQLAQLGALDEFWRRHFQDDSGFIAAHYDFASMNRRPTHWRESLRRTAASACGAPIASRHSNRSRRTRARLAEITVSRIWSRSTTRDLPIFFGRSEAIKAPCVSSLMNAAMRAPRSCWSWGLSGTGKSSLVKAGIVPSARAAPARHVGMSFRRRVIFRPADAVGGEDLFEAFARALTASRPGVGLPELGPCPPLAEAMRSAPKLAVALFDRALEDVAQADRARGLMLPSEAATLIVVIDQLEELFTDQRIPADQRQRFLILISALAHGGRVWVLATMRADLWHRGCESAELVSLARGKRRFDLSPPTSSEIGQMIRLPPGGGRRDL